METSIRENKLMVGIVTVLVLMLSLMFSVSVSADEGEIEWVLATDDDFSGDSNGNFKYKGKGEYVVIPHTIKGVPVTSYYRMFSGYKGSQLKGVKSTNGNVTNMFEMFRGASNLTELDLSSLDTSNVTNMNSMFFGASNLTELDLSNFDTSNVTDMSYMFSDTSSLTELDLSSFDTSNVTNMDFMFSYASSLTELDISSFDTSNVTDMRYMFVGTSSLTKLDLRNFDTSKVTNMSNMFNGTSSLTKLDLRSFDTSSVTSMSYMFEGASSLTKLDLSSFDTSSVTYIVTDMRDMFRNVTVTEGYARTQEDVNRFMISSRKPTNLVFTIKEDSSVLKGEHDISANILSGGLHLSTPPVVNFGEVVLGEKEETYYTGFEGDIEVQDLRGSHDGWRLVVRGSNLDNNGEKLDTGTLTLGDLKTVTNGVSKVLSGTMNVDSNEDVEVVNATKGTGTTVIGFGEQAIGLVVEPKKVRKGEYSMDLEWSIVTGP